MKSEDTAVGQLVRVSGGAHFLAGKIGTVRVIDSDKFLGVEFDGTTDAPTHNLSGLLSNRNGYYLRPEQVALVIRSEGFGTVGAITLKPLLPIDAKERKEIPIAGGFMDYFPQAMIEVAKVSFEGNKQHNPGQPLHWARGKSMDHADTMQRHFLERGTMDTDGVRHSAKMVWRALAILQEEMEAEGHPIARGSRPAEKK